MAAGHGNHNVTHAASCKGYASRGQRERNRDRRAARILKGFRPGYEAKRHALRIVARQALRDSMKIEGA